MIVWWIVLSAYIVGYLVTFRRIAGQYAWHKCENPVYSYNRGRGYPSGEQWAGAIALGMAAALVWPVALPVAYGIATARVGGGFFYTPASVREKQLAERIRELEQEAGIR